MPLTQPLIHARLAGARLPLLIYPHLALAPLIAAYAQQDSIEPRSAIVGQLVARETHAAIAGASVALTGTAPSLATKTDSLGQFTLTGLAPGVFLLEIRAVGYAAGSWRLTLKSGKVLTHLFEMDLLGYDLPGVTVKGRPGQTRFADFERRRQSGKGYFLTQEEIERANPATLIDVLVTVRGVKQVCLANDCSAIMVRSPPGCYPQYFLDGHESTPYFARNTPPQDIRGIEIYRGSSETPGEFTGSNSACGVIAIWTKSAP